MAGRETRWSNLSFALLFLGVIALFLVVVAPFLIPVLMAAFLVALLYPMNDAITRWWKGRRRLASLFSTFLVFLLLVVPLGGLGFVFVQQGIELVEKLQALLGPEGLSTLLGGNVPEPLRPLMERLEGTGFREQISRLVGGLAGFLAKAVTSIVGITTNLVIGLFLGFVSVYYFFADGHRIVRTTYEASPLEPRYLEEFYLEVRKVAQTMIFVNFLTALVQGVVGAFSFILVGLPTPVVWAALMALFAFVPMVGTGLVWVPAGLILILTGRPAAGIFVLAWGALVIGSVDNLLRPLLAKGRMNLHPLLIFLTIFGGIAVFGFLGVVIGPMIGSIFTAMVRIWERDFVPRLY